MIYDIYIENVFKSEKHVISLKKQLKIITKIITNYYKYEKLTTKVIREIKVSQNTVAYLFKNQVIKRWNLYENQILYLL